MKKSLTVSATEFDTILPELLKENVGVPLCVTGSSMSPLLHHQRDVVWLKACEKKECKRGRILLFKRQNGQYILHRIRKVLPNDTYLINGDAQVWCEVIKHEQIVAIVYEIQRKGKHISCNRISLRLWDMMWYPTRPFRPLIFKIVYHIKHIFKK